MTARQQIDRARPDQAWCVDLSGHLTAVAATTDAQRSQGAFNAWGNSYPAEELWFGGVRDILGVPFRLPDKKTPESPDHLEALGQVIPIAPCPLVSTLCLLASGEMGEQELLVDLWSTDGKRTRLQTLIPGWLLDGETTELRAGCLCSHLHYPGDYELALLRPALHCRQLTLPAPADICKLRLHKNPLAHVFAMTLLRAEACRG